MKICKKIIAMAVTVAMLLVCFSAAAEAVPSYPAVPEGYDGFVTVTFEASSIGWGYIVEPTLVPYVEGETVAQVSVRLLNSLGIEYLGGEPNDSFYLTGVACDKVEDGIEPDVPAYLMEQIEAYPAWAEENLGYVAGEWTGAENGNGYLGEFDFTTLAGWMIADNDVATPVGAGAWAVQQGHSYRWMFSIYGYGMDVGLGDGWGMFPAFDNPAEGVTRSNAVIAYSQIVADAEFAAEIADGGSAYAEFTAFKSTLEDLASSQQAIDESLQALLAALDNGGVLTGDVDGDGRVSISDAVQILRHAMGIQLLDESVQAIADVNGDGVISATDAVMALRIAMAD